MPSAETPEPLGPRNWGQYLVSLVAAEASGEVPKWNMHVARRRVNVCFMVVDEFFRFINSGDERVQEGSIFFHFPQTFGKSFPGRLELA